MLEPRAIALAVMIVTVSLAAVLGLWARSSQYPKALRLWGWGIATAGTSAFLNTAQEELPAWLSVVLAVPLMFFGIGWILAGIQRISQTPVTPAVYLAPALIMWVGSIYWGLWEPNYLYRAMLYSVLMGGLMTWMALKVWSLRNIPALKAGVLFVGIPTAVMAVLFLIRAPALVIFPQNSAGQAGSLNGWVYLIGGAAYMSIGAGLLLLAQLLRVRDFTYSAEHDALTQLLNRRGLLEVLPESLDGCWALFIDVDHFKHLNDQAGHAAGDLVLQWLGQVLKKSSRQGDLVARLGGEEFVALAWHMTDAGAHTWGQRLCERIQNESLSATGHAITVSIGLAQALPHESLHSLLLRADQATYEAKRQGRNRVVMAKKAIPTTPMSDPASNPAAST